MANRADSKIPTSAARRPISDPTTILSTKVQSKRDSSGPVRKFVIAVRRERRHDVPADWVEIIRRLDGVMVEEPANGRRIVVKASVNGIDRVKDRLSDFVHIEEPINHETA